MKQCDGSFPDSIEWCVDVGQMKHIGLQPNVVGCLGLGLRFIRNGGDIHWGHKSAMTPETNMRKRRTLDLGVICVETGRLRKTSRH